MPRAEDERTLVGRPERAWVAGEGAGARGVVEVRLDPLGQDVESVQLARREAIHVRLKGDGVPTLHESALPRGFTASPRTPASTPLPPA